MKLKHALLLTTLFSGSAAAAEIDVTIQNLTHGSYFTPIAVVAHDSEARLFEVGKFASTEIEQMAEGGSIEGIQTIAADLGAPMVANPAEGVLAPGAMTMATLDTGDNKWLSIVSMILPSNDGFMGVDSWYIPDEAGTYTVYVNAYDAGTEANDELLVPGPDGATGAGIPAAPGDDAGTGGTGFTDSETNNYIHIHRGVVGDTDLAGGKSDLDSRIHRWLNPVAKVMVTVK